jgi:two-component system nitrogen regulation response regulator GlnG/two-component system response regulator HydG
LIDDGTLPDNSSCRATDGAAGALLVALVLCWSSDEPDRVGEVLFLPPGRPWLFGRGVAQPDDRAPRVHLAREADGDLLHPGPLQSPKLSRQQLLLRATGPAAVEVKSIGRCRLRHNGEEVERATASAGDTLRVGNQLIFLCVSRPAIASAWPPGYGPHRTGQPDRNGIVGESEATWRLRSTIDFVAERRGHVLICGASGTGKELVAGALHARSARGARALVARNAATFPEGLIDAELFGNGRNYPNAGMAERPGLVGAADGTSLFLDEIAELPLSLQPHLLRVLDRGEYQRLGESSVRQSDFRLLAATNRPDALKHDLRARFRFTIDVPSLNDRREDIPFLLRHLLRQHAVRDPHIAAKYFARGDPAGHASLEPRLVDDLLRHPYTMHVRELDALLWRSLAGLPPAPAAAGNSAPVAAGPRVEERALAAPTARAPKSVDPKSVPREALERALAEHGGVREEVWRALGLSSRHALSRLMVKHGIRR